jgi:hypothetical protein
VGAALRQRPHIVVRTLMLNDKSYKHRSNFVGSVCEICSLWRDRLQEKRGIAQNSQGHSPKVIGRGKSSTAEIRVKIGHSVVAEKLWIPARVILLLKISDFAGFLKVILGEVFGHQNFFAVKWWPVRFIA